MISGDFQNVGKLEDMPEGSSKGIFFDGYQDQAFVVRKGDKVFAWLNDCPHDHRPLEYKKDQFLSGDSSHIVCYAHSAHFDIQTGKCFSGPCKGQSLKSIEALVKNDQVLVSLNLPSLFD